jgi:hypothetical protein
VEELEIGMIFLHRDEMTCSSSALSFQGLSVNATLVSSCLYFHKERGIVAIEGIH